MHRSQLLYRFELNDYLPLYQQINTESFLKQDFVIHKADSLLTLHLKGVLLLQTLGQHGLINRLQKPRSQFPMNPHRGINDCAGYIVQFFQGISPRPPRLRVSTAFNYCAGDHLTIQTTT